MCYLCRYAVVPLFYKMLICSKRSKYTYLGLRILSMYKPNSVSLQS